MIKVINFIDNKTYDITYEDYDYWDINSKRCISQCMIAYNEVMKRNSKSYSHTYIGLFYQTFFREVYLILPTDSFESSYEQISNEYVTEDNIIEIGKAFNLPLDGVARLLKERINEIRSFTGKLMDGSCDGSKMLSKSELNQGTKLPFDSTDCSRPVTICGINNMIKDPKEINSLLDNLKKWLNKYYAQIKNYYDKTAVDEIIKETKKYLIALGPKLSKNRGNLLEMREDGLYYGIEAPPDIVNLYVDSINGNDSIPLKEGGGTRSKPFKTLDKALGIENSWEIKTSRNIYIKCGGDYYITQRYRVNGNRVSIIAYDDPYLDKQVTLTPDFPYYYRYPVKEINRPNIYLCTFIDRNSHKRKTISGFYVPTGNTLAMKACKIYLKENYKEDLDKAGITAIGPVMALNEENYGYYNNSMFYGTDTSSPQIVFEGCIIDCTPSEHSNHNYRLAATSIESFGLDIKFVCSQIIGEPNSKLISSIGRNIYITYEGITPFDSSYSYLEDTLRNRFKNEHKKLFANLEYLPNGYILNNQCNFTVNPDA